MGRRWASLVAALFAMEGATMAMAAGSSSSEGVLTFAAFGWESFKPLLARGTRSVDAGREPTLERL